MCHSWFYNDLPTSVLLSNYSSYCLCNCIRKAPTFLKKKKKKKHCFLVLTPCKVCNSYLKIAMADQKHNRLFPCFKYRSGTFTKTHKMNDMLMLPITNYYLYRAQWLLPKRCKSDARVSTQVAGKEVKHVRRQPHGSFQRALLKSQMLRGVRSLVRLFGWNHYMKLLSVKHAKWELEFTKQHKQIALL